MSLRSAQLGRSSPDWLGRVTEFAEWHSPAWVLWSAQTSKCWSGAQRGAGELCQRVTAQKIERICDRKPSVAWKANKQANHQCFGFLCARRNSLGQAAPFIHSSCNCTTRLVYAIWKTKTRQKAWGCGVGGGAGLSFTPLERVVNSKLFFICNNT